MVGFNLSKFDDAREKVLRSFIPPALNEGNVQAIFNRCLRKKDSPSLLCSGLFPEVLGYESSSDIRYGFDKNVILSNKNNIKYLFGQLQSVHDRKQLLTVEDFDLNYLGKKWTTNKTFVFMLLNLANCEEIELISSFSRRKNDTAHFVNITPPTLSPKDPNFPAWWEEHKSEWEVEG